LDYPAAGGCPSLLVEPAATNLVLQSQTLDNASWAPFGTTVTANAETAPDGTLTAETITIADSNSFIQQVTALGAGTYTISCYVKVISTTTAGIMRFNPVVDGVGISLTFTPTGDWQRVEATFTATIDVTMFRIRGVGGGFVGTVAIWGAQLETGSVATSYIPTTAATATRNADVISKTGVSGFIGQTEGTIYAEVDANKVPVGIPIAIGDGTANNRIQIQFPNSTTLFSTIRIAGANADYSVTIPAIAASGGILKFALAYSANDYCFAFNGSIYSPSTATRPVPLNMSVFYLGQSALSAAQLNDRIRAAALYTTRLSNDELAALTTL
jgi:hypothetical protein